MVQPIRTENERKKEEDGDHNGRIRLGHYKSGQGTLFFSSYRDIIKWDEAKIGESYRFWGIFWRAR